MDVEERIGWAVVLVAAFAVACPQAAHAAVDRVESAAHQVVADVEDFVRGDA